MVSFAELFERQLDIDADAQTAPGAFVSGAHDAAPGAGDDHPARFRHEPAELHRPLVIAVVPHRARRAEHRHFASAAKRREHLESPAHLLESGVRDLEIHGLRAIDAEPKSGCRNLINRTAFGICATLIDELHELAVELGVPRGIS